MTYRTLLLAPLTLFVLAFFVPNANGKVENAYAAYIDPTLTALPNTSEKVSVIVSGEDSDAVASTVVNQGGAITSDLWLIHAVGAEIATDQLAKLAADKSITSIIANHEVQSSRQVPDVAKKPQDEDDEDRGNGNGNSNHNRKPWFDKDDRSGFSYSLVNDDKNIDSPITATPNGGAFIISRDGEYHFLDKDGQSIASGNLNAGKDYQNQPVVDTNGTVYILDKEKELSAISASGQILWQYKSKDKIIGNILLQGNQNILFLDKHGQIFALDKNNGKELWKKQEEHIHFEAEPTLSSNGNLYIPYKNGEVYSYASDGSLNWNEKFSGGKKVKVPIVVNANEIIFVVSDKKKLLSINPDGSLRYTYNAPKDIKVKPQVGPNDSVYIAADTYLIKLDASGREVFRIKEGKFKQSPVLSPDSKTVYIINEKYLNAYNSETGSQVWRFAIDEEVEVLPVVDSAGNIHFGDDEGFVYIVDSEGQLIFKRSTSGAISNSLVMSQDEQRLFMQVRDNTINILELTAKTIVEVGAPDVEPTDNPTIWKNLSTPSLDVGAHLVHSRAAGAPLNSEGSGLGYGVGIALLDSGVAFDSDMRSALNLEFIDPSFRSLGYGANFEGQVDLTGPGICHGTFNQARNICVKSALDPSGHGSYLASVIWSQLTDADSGAKVGIAPYAPLLSVRVLDEHGRGSYEDLIEGIQYIVENRYAYNTRIINISITGEAKVPYFVDPVNRAVEQAWSKGLIVVAAAGNSGPGSETISTPGNDPYIITVGSHNTARTPSERNDDSIPYWSASGPSLDGFIKPDIVATGSHIVGYLPNSSDNPSNVSNIAKNHPDYAKDKVLYRLSGTSVSTAITSGVIALMLEQHPSLTPNEVKFQLASSAQPVLNSDGYPLSPLVQGAGRIWAPDAVALKDGWPQSANQGMDIYADLAHPWVPGDSTNPAWNPDLAYHYQGVVQRTVDAQHEIYIYYIEGIEGGTNELIILGGATVAEKRWIPISELALKEFPHLTDLGFNLSHLWKSTEFAGSNDWYWSGGNWYWSGGNWYWGGGNWYWGGGNWYWGGGNWYWGGGNWYWGGGNWYWGGGLDEMAFESDKELHEIKQKTFSSQLILPSDSTNEAGGQ